MKEEILKNVRKLIKNISNDRISESAAECSYYVILSFIPFIILLLSLIQYTKINSEEIFEILNHFLPSNISEIIIQIIKEAYSKSIGTISVSIIFTIVSAGKGLLALTKELNKIYNCSQYKKNWIRLKFFSIIETIFFLFLIIFILILFVFGKFIITTLGNYFSKIEKIIMLNENFYEISFLFLGFIIFLIMYKFLPRHKVELKSQIRGAFFASALLNILSRIFSEYLNIFKGFSYTYGSLTALILIMMWTYAFFYVIFLGAEINKI